LIDGDSDGVSVGYKLGGTDGKMDVKALGLGDDITVGLGLVSDGTNVGVSVCHTQTTDGNVVGDGDGNVVGD